MMSLGLVLLLAAEPVKLAAPGVICVGLEQRLCDAYLEHFVSLLSAGGRVRVTTAQDIAQLLGLEREKQLLGCEASGCVTELSGALGVDGVITASLARTDSGRLVTLRIIHAHDGSVWVQGTSRVDDDEALERYLEEEAAAFAAQLAPAPGGGGLVRWAPAIAGGACLVAGGVLFGWSKADAALLADPTKALRADEVSTIASRGKVTQPAGALLLGAGAAGVAASLLWVTLAPAAPAQVSLVPAAGGATLTVGGPLP